MPAWAGTRAELARQMSRNFSVTAVSRPLHAGRTVIVVQTDPHDRAGWLAAQVTQSQAVLTGPS